MKAIMLMYDSLNRHMLSPYGCEWTRTPNFSRLAQHTIIFDNCWCGSMPCMPARRELHTGRYNFLHRSWGPLEPFDDSMPQLLKENDIYTHLVSDHYHYWEDGGATYHQRYSSWECIRGQEGDNWKPSLKMDSSIRKYTGNVCGELKDRWIEQDFANRKFMNIAEKQPQYQTFSKGLEFIKNFHNQDNWFLQIETFDPHEPFFIQKYYKNLFPDHYDGKMCDWPDYRSVNENDSPAFIEHMRMQYAALLYMCDQNLGKLLDIMDQYHLWDDTMLIVNTDHGFLLSEHGEWAKCHCPFYSEVAHIPLFIWDPRSGKMGIRRKQLVQTIDLPATLLEFFNVSLPANMQGIPIRNVIETGAKIREGGLFGIFGGQICCTDGKWVYMRSPIPENQPRYEYTLMPMRHGGRRAFIDDNVLRTMQIHAPLAFTKGIPVLRINNISSVSQANYPTVLYNIEDDPNELLPVEDPSQEEKMIKLMKKLMRENDAPDEQYERMAM